MILCVLCGWNWGTVALIIDFMLRSPTYAPLPMHPSGFNAITVPCYHIGGDKGTIDGNNYAN